MKTKVQSATLAIELTPVQHAAVKTIAQTFRMKPEDAFKVLAFIPVNTNYDIGLLHEEFENAGESVLAGELPSFPDGRLAGCINFDNPSDEKIALRMTPDELAKIVGALSSDLQCDTTGSDSEADPAKAVKKWRNASPTWVKEATARERRHAKEMKAIGLPRPGIVFTDEKREGYDETANLLERLIAQLPAEEVAS